MLRLIEAKNFRSLRMISTPLRDFHILIGPNASGKSTFLDTVAFLGDLVGKGLDEAITDRSTDIRELFFKGEGDRFELAVELEIPDTRRAVVKQEEPNDRIRYEVCIGLNSDTDQYEIFDEQVILYAAAVKEEISGVHQTFFSSLESEAVSLITGKLSKDQRRTLKKTHSRNDNFYIETGRKEGKGGWAPSIRLGPRKSALANLPDDEEKFPATTWLREILVNGTQRLMLDSSALRRSSRPGQGKIFRPDGGNLPWVVESLRLADEARFRGWIEHLQSVLPDLQGISVGELTDTRHRFLQLVYRNGLKIPSWMVSDGTLRMLALTLPAYLPSFEGIYLIEEPENGVHPMAMEAVYQSLRSVYSAQILLATHSPVLLGCAELDEVLCFRKDETGATSILPGSSHPALQEWKGGLTITDLYASGVLG